MWEEIVKLLDEEIGYYKLMVRAMDTQEMAMRRGDAVKVRECVKLHEQLMTRVSLADNKLREYIAAIKQAHQVKANLYLRHLAKLFADEKHKQPIIERGEMLRALAAHLKKKTAHSKKLIHKQLHFIDYNVNILTGTVAGETYGGSGVHNGAYRQRKMFDESV